MATIQELDKIASEIRTAAKMPHIMGDFITPAYVKGAGYFSSVHIGGSVCVGESEAVDKATIIKLLIEVHSEIIECATDCINQLTRIL